MFFLKNFVHDLILHPRNISQNIQSLIQDYLYKNVEGTCTSSGFIISVLKIIKINEGRVLNNGHVSFKIEYQAMILKPQTTEIVDCQIVSSSNFGYFASVGPMNIFIYNDQIPQNLASELAVNTLVRLKIIGTKISSSKIFAIGTLNDDCLAIIDSN